MTSDDTVIVVSISDRTKCKLTKRFDNTIVTWSAIEKQLLTWSDLSPKAKELRLKISFNYIDSHHSAQSANRKGEKRGKSSVTRRMIGERDARLDTEDHTSGEKPIWRSVYNVARCDSSTYPQGPHCWVDPKGKSTIH